MKQNSLSRGLRLLSYLQIAFAAMIGFGSAFEVLNLLWPALLPELQQNPIAQLHHQNRVVGAWTLWSNIAIVAIAIGLIRGAFRMLRRDEGGRALSRRLAFAMLGISLGAALISVFYLFPLLSPMLQSADESQRAMAIIFFSSIAASLFFVPAYPVAAIAILGRDRVKAQFQ